MEAQTEMSSKMSINQPDIKDEAEGGTERKPDVSKKRKRHRKRAHYDKLCKQMEFYFSDANITKNRMMLEMVTKSAYADLANFLEFNKVKEITNKLEDLQKSLKNSKVLELSPDLKGVKRKIPFSPAKIKNDVETEACTIYVENVPAHVNHEWLETIFQVFGPIAYISVPKFKHNGQPKGFAFVEFKEPEFAGRCLEAYGQEGACLSADIDPSNLLSVKTFEGSTGTSPSNSQHPPESDCKPHIIPTGSKRKGTEEPETEHSVKKEKIKEESDEKPTVKSEFPEQQSMKEFKPTSSKEIKSESESPVKSTENITIKSEVESTNPSPSNVTIKSEESTTTSKSETTSTVTVSPDKRKRKLADSDNSSPKKGLNGSSFAAKLAKIESGSSSSDANWTSDSSFDSPVTDDESSDSDDSSSDSESEVQSSQSPEKRPQVTNGDGSVPEVAQTGDKIKKKKLRRRNKAKKTAEEKLESDSIKLMVLPKRTWRQLRNRYLNLQRNNMGKLKRQLQEQKIRADHYKNFYNKNTKDSSTRVESKVVKIELSTPAESFEDFHRQITVELAEGLGHDGIQTYENKFFQFVDYKENELVAHVRLNGNKKFEECVTAFVEKAGRVFTSVRILNAEETEAYRKAVQASMSEKQSQPRPFVNNGPRRKPIIRGKDKILQAAAKANTHLRFPDDDDEDESSEVNVQA